MRKLFTVTLPAAMVLGAVTLAVASPMEAVGARQTYFKKLGYEMKKMGELAKAYDPAAAKTEAEALAPLLASDFKDFFPEGSSVAEISDDNRAKPAIWANFDDFLAKEKAFKDAGAALVAAAGGEDAGAFAAAFGKFGGTCKACHDEYRLPE